jgi:Primase C terminal 2 (PriCT-2)/Family of unknown function (DUF5906)
VPTSPRYFIGTSVHGPVKASTARNFREVVDALRILAPLDISRASFLALNKKERNEKKQVPFLVPATFDQSPSKRTYQHAVHCNLIFLDLDEGSDGKCAAAPFYNHPESLSLALAGFNYAAHTTASSTPEKPRMRIILDADEIPVERYPDAVATVARMLGLPSLTTESRVAVQPMYAPVNFSDSSEEDHPLIAWCIDGRAFKVSDITGHSAEYKNGKNGTSNGAAPSVDGLEFLRAPIPEITIAVAKEALSHIEPDCSYFEWLETAAALKHQFSHSKPEEAYTLFDEWSAQGSKYDSAEETRAKWDSLRPTPIGRCPVTIRTLLHRAVVGGWNDGTIKQSCFNEVVRWMEEVGTFTELIDRSVSKILACPLLSATQEDLLVNEVCKNAKKRFSFSISPTAIRKDIARLKAQTKAQQAPTEKAKEPLWAKGVCYVSATQDFYRHRTGEKYKAESFNASYSRWLLPTEQSLKEAGIPVTPATLSRAIVNPTEYALNHLKIPVLFDYAYDPSRPTEIFFTYQGRKFVNTYNPTYPELDPKGAPEAGALLQSHLTNLITEPEYRRVLTDFMAFMVQSPGRKIRWAVLIQGVEGCGKTFLAELMKAVLGKEHVKTIDGAAIKGNWNEWAFGHQLVVLEEVRVSGTNKFEVMNTLKPLITNEDISMNERFRNNRNVLNISNYMMFTNHQTPLALSPGDRRYFVIKSPLQAKQQVAALGENYFPQLFALLRDHPGALRSYLSDWEISPEFRADGHAPRTKYVEELIHDSASDLTATARRIIKEGDFPLIQFDIVSSKALYEALTIEEGVHCTVQQLAHVLRDEGYHQDGRHLLNDERHYLWVRPGVQDAAEQAAERQKKGIANLGMEAFFT